MKSLQKSATRFFALLLISLCFWACVAAVGCGGEDDLTSSSSPVIDTESSSVSEDVSESGSENDYSSSDVIEDSESSSGGIELPEIKI